jgi:hypothetical protein
MKQNINKQFFSSKTTNLKKNGSFIDIRFSWIIWLSPDTLKHGFKIQSSLAGRSGIRPTQGWNRVKLKKKHGKKKPD